VNFHAGDVFGDSAEGLLNYTGKPSGKGLPALDIVVGIDLYLHADLLSFARRHDGSLPQMNPDQSRLHASPGEQSAAHSPCVRNCCLDENDVCLGCGRLLEEILRWHEASDEEREGLRALASNRLHQRAQRFNR